MQVIKSSPWATWRALPALLVALCLARPAASDEPLASLHSVNAGERLALEQIDQWLSNGQDAEAIELIVRTMDEAGGRLIAVQESVPRHHTPLKQFLQDRLLRWGRSNPELLAAYRRRYDAFAAKRIEDVRLSGDVMQALRLVDDVLATQYGDEALLLAADLAWQRGWVWTTIGCLRRLDPRWQACADGTAGSEVTAVGWEMFLGRMSEDQIAPLAAGIAKRDSQNQGWPIGCYVDSDLNQAEVGLRLVIAYQAAGERTAAKRLAAMMEIWYPDSRVTMQGSSQSLQQALTEVTKQLTELRQQASVTSQRSSSSLDRAGRFEWTTLGGDGQRVFSAPALGELEGIPAWVWDGPQASSATGPDNGPDNGTDTDTHTGTMQFPIEPPLGRISDRDHAQAPHSFVAVHRGLVMFPLADRLYILDLKSGQPWPQGIGDQPLFAAITKSGELPITGQMPYDGEPQASVSAADGRVAMRIGPAGSGWLSVMRPRGGVSQIVVLDLQQEGKLLQGFPLRSSDVSRDAKLEFEGAPLIVGSRMYVGATVRDDALMTVTVIGVDLASGQVLFQSPLVSASRPLETDDRSLGGQNRVAQALVSYREGTIYYHGDGGVMVAIDAENGQLRWGQQYPRGEWSEAGYAQRRRAPRRQSSPTALIGPLAILAPADLDRLVAVDAMDGRMLWTTDLGIADDVDQVLGQVDGHLILAGDSLQWLERDSGRWVAQWPVGTSRQPFGALPQPRRAGRAVMAGDQIVWPTADSLWFFNARLDPSSALPIPKRKIGLASLGLRGGDVVVAGGTLLLHSGTSLAAFRSSLNYNGDSPRENEP